MSQRDKSVFISYSSKDQDYALELASAIEESFGKTNIWVDFFDLDAGDELALKISGAIENAKWFILLVSESSIKSKWVKFELNIATFMSIEKEDLRIISIKIDNCEIPSPLRGILESRSYIEVKNNFMDAIDQAVKLISKEKSTRSDLRHVFFNRGEEIDNLQIAVESSKTIFIFGVYGIGKSAMVEEALKIRLGRPFVKISIRSGHDMEILSRQIIAQTESVQPDKDANPNSLLDNAIEAFFAKQTKDRTLLIIDNAENAMDEENKFREYFLSFLNQYIKKEFNSPIIIISTRRPELSFDIEEVSQNLIIGKLEDKFITPLIKNWIRGSSSESWKKVDSYEIEKINKYIGGHPLAAKLIASHLILFSPRSVLKEGFITEFRLRMAEFILRDIINQLTQLDKHILQSIAIAELGITIEDLSEVTLMKSYNLDHIQQSVNKLTNALLISQEAEILKLHSFIQDYFLKEAEESKSIKMIAHDLGNRIYQKLFATISQYNQLSYSEEPERVVFLSKQIIQFAISSHRLLLISGNMAKARRIPYKLEGHIRELILITYQRFKDYKQCLIYADIWLKLEPNDIEIALYKARSLRRQQKYRQAEEILSKLWKNPDRYIRAKVDRERGLMALDNNKFDSAIKHFRNACIRRPSGVPVYPLALADLANALIKHAENRLYDDTNEEQEKKIFEEALGLLNDAKDYLPRFDDLHLTSYISALAHTDQRNKAEGILEEALKSRPDDPYLNLKKADLLSNNPRKLDEAIEHVDVAIRRNLDWGYPIKSKIMLNKREFEEALELINKYKPKSPRDKIFMTDIKCKILIEMRRFQELRDFLVLQGIKNNPFIDSLKIQNEIKCAEKHIYDQQYSQAETCIKEGERLLSASRNKYSIRKSFLSMEEEIGRLKENINKLKKN